MGQRTGFLVHQYSISSQIGGNQVTAVARTRDGYAWVGTQNNLYRFNGHSFTEASKLLSVPPLRVLVLLVHGDRLYVGTNGRGVWVISPDSVVNLSRTDGLAGDVIWDLKPDGDGGIWVATSLGVSHIPKIGAIESPDALSGFPSDLAVDAAQDLWAVFADGSLRRYTGSSTLDHSLPRERSSAIAATTDGAIWLGTERGLRRVSVPDHSVSDLLTGLSSDAVVHLEVSEDHVWAATESGQLWQRIDGEWFHRHLGERLPGRRITDLLQDAEDNLWVATRSGLALVAGGSVVTLGPDFTGPDVWAVARDRDGQIWMASDGGGISAVDPENYRLEPLEVDQPSSEIWSLAPSPQGGIWAGSGDAGAFLIRDGKVARVIDDLPVLAVWSLLDSARSGLWIGTDGGGLIHLQDDERSIYDTRSGLAGNRVWALYETGEGTLWVGTNQGLCRMSAVPTKCLGTAEGLPDAAVWSVDPGPVNGLWISTDRGLALLDDDRLHPVRHDPLSSAAVFGVLTDEDGGLWALSSQGLHYVEPASVPLLTRNAAEGTFVRSYGSADGLTQTLDSGASPPMIQDDMGGLWLATSGGLVLVQPSKLKREPIAVKLLIEQLEVDGQLVSGEQKRIDPGPRHARFHFAALAFGREDITRLQTRLLGVSERWSDPTLERSVGYSGLGPGDYRFEVRLAPNSVGLVSDVSAMDFSVSPYWHERLWVRPAGVLMLMMLIVAVYRFRMRYVRRMYQVRTARLKEKMDAATALQASEHRFRNIYENVSDLVISVDAGGNLVQANPAAQRLLPKCEVGTALTQSLPGLPELEALAAGVTLEVQIDDPGDSGRRTLELSSARGSDQTVLITGRDVTEQRALQEKMAISQRLEAIGKLTAGVAHDFNNLLTVVQGNTSLLLKNLKTAEDRTLAQAVTDAAGRAAELTGKLLSVGRRSVVTLKNINLNDHLRAMEDLLHRVIEENIRIRMRLDGNPVVEMDSGLLEQIVINLVVNSRDAIEGSGEIVISTRSLVLNRRFVAQHPGSTTGRHVLLEVTDTGCGMNAEVSRAAFEPFFTTKGPASGSGLGLSTVYGAVKQSGGSIYIDSEPGVGTRMRVYLPTIDGEGAGPTVGVMATEEVSDQRILLVEDDPRIVEVAQRMLVDAGFEVTTATGVADGLAAALTQIPDLVVSDIVMGDGSGLQMIRQLRQAGHDIPVLFISGYSGDRAERPTLSNQALLSKPFGRDQLVSAVQRLLGDHRKTA